MRKGVLGWLGKRILLVIIFIVLIAILVWIFSGIFSWETNIMEFFRSLV